MKATVLAVAGSKKSGKTTTIEVLIRELTKRGYKIAAVKHIPEPNFTVDKEGKDTWRFAQSGAKTIISASSDEVTTIQKLSGKDLSLRAILQKCRGNEIVILEGFREIVSMNKNVLKIVAVKSAGEALESVKSFHPILAFTGPYSTRDLNLSVPYVDMLKNPEKIADIVERAVRENAL